MKYRTINAFRGDTVEVQLLVPIPSGTVVRIHLRKTPESDTFYNLDITNNKIIIPEDISSACDGTWYFDVEFTKDLVVETVQRVTVYFDDDISRVYGTEATAPTSDFERRKIYAESFYKRMPEGEAIEIPLEGLDHFVTDAQAAASQTAADRIVTGQDRTQTGLDRIATGADVVQTGLDRVATGADVVQTGLDRAATGSDVVQTGLDRVATGADVAQTGLDRAATGADVEQTGLDKVATGEDRVQTGLDRTATGADVVQTGLDRAATGADVEQTGLDKIATGEDRVQTGLDRTATGADVVQTGLDRAATDQIKTDVQGLKSDVQQLKTDTSGIKDLAVGAKDDAVTAKNTATTKASEADNSAYLAAESATAAAKTKCERDVAVVNPAMVLQKDASVYRLNISANSTVTFDTSQLTAGKVWWFMLELSMPALKTIAWPSNIYWYGGSDFSRIGTYIYGFYSNDNGQQWIASKACENTQYVNPLTNKIVYVDGGKADDTGNGLTWATAKKNVQAGIDLAIAGDLVFVKAGTYLPTTERTAGTARSKSFIMKSGVHLYGGFQGTETSPGERVMTRTTEILPLPYGDYILNIDVPTYPSILSGDLDGDSVDGGQAVDYKGNRLTNITNNAYIVVYSSVASPTVFNGFKVTGGNNSGTGSSASGGGIFCDNSLLFISNCHVLNITGTTGSAIRYGSTNSCLIHNITGGVINSGTSSVLSIYYINNSGTAGLSSHTVNTALIKYFNGYQTLNGCTATNIEISNCVSSYSNTWQNGFTNCKIHHNTSPYGGGAQDTAINCEYSNNTGTQYSGGVGGGGTYTNIKIVNNQGPVGASNGGTFINCTIARNVSTSSSGGVTGNPTLKNCVVWGNRNSNGQLHNVTLGTGSANYCAFENEVVAGTNNVNLNATNDAAGGPYFLNPSLSAGLTDAATDYDIGASSALINAGLDSYNTTGEGATYDLKHRARKVGTIDIGAFEKQA